MNVFFYGLIALIMGMSFTPYSINSIDKEIPVERTVGEDDNGEVEDEDE